MEHPNSDHQASAPDPAAILENVGWVRSLAIQLAGHPGVADDIAQETWVRVLRNPAPDGVSFRQWVIGIMRRVSKEDNRKSHRRREREAIVSREKQRDRDVDLQRQVEIEREVVAQVMNLREPWRRVLLARFFEGKTVEEIALAEGITESAVRSRMSKAYADLRGRLIEKPETPAGAFFCVALADPSAPIVAGADALSKLSPKAFGWKVASLAAMVIVSGSAAWVLSSDRDVPETTTLARAVAVPAVEEATAANAVPSATSSGRESLSDVSTTTDPNLVATSTEVPAQPGLGWIRLRVLDDRGEEVSGIPIMVRWMTPRQYSSGAWVGVSGPVGDPVAVPLDSLGPTGRADLHEIEALIRGVGLDLTPVILDTRNLPTEPVELVISQPFGSLELEFIDDAGEALSEWVDVVANSEYVPGDGTGPTCSAPPGQSAILTPIGLDATVYLKAKPRSGWGQGLRNAKGPAVRGEVKTLRVDFVEPQPTVAFQLEAPSGKPLDQTTTVETYFTPDAPGAEPRKGTMEVLEDLGFVASFHPRSLAGQSGTLRIQVESGAWPDGDPPLLATLPVTLEEPRGRLDLGTVTVAHDESPWAGIVLGADGQPVGGGRIQLMEWDSSSDPQGWSGRIRSPSVVSRTDGTFEVSPSPNAALLGVMASSGIDRASRPVALIDRLQPMELTLQPCASVTGQVILPAGVDPTRYWVTVTASNEPELRSASGRLNADGRFTLYMRTDTKITLELSEVRGTLALATRHDVMVPLNGGLQDHAITPWDVRAEVRVLNLHIRLPGGEPAQKGVVRAFRKTHYLDGPDLTLVVPIADTGLTVDVTGCRQFVGRTASLPSPIQLAPGLQVDLEIHAGPQTAPFLEGVKVSLYRTDILPGDERRALDADAWLEESAKIQWTERRAVMLGGETRYICHQPGEYFLRFREMAGEYSTRTLPNDLIPALLRDVRFELTDTDTVQTIRFDWP